MNFGISTVTFSEVDEYLASDLEELEQEESTTDIEAKEVSYVLHTTLQRRGF